MVPLDMKRRYEPKHPEVLRINPKGQVPVVIEGAVGIFASTQIFDRRPRCGLRILRRDGKDKLRELLCRRFTTMRGYKLKKRLEIRKAVPLRVVMDRGLGASATIDRATYHLVSH